MNYKHLLQGLSLTVLLSTSLWTSGLTIDQIKKLRLRSPAAVHTALQAVDDQRATNIEEILSGNKLKLQAMEILGATNGQTIYDISLELQQLFNNGNQTVVRSLLQLNDLLGVPNTGILGLINLRSRLSTNTLYSLTTILGKLNFIMTGNINGNTLGLLENFINISNSLASGTTPINTLILQMSNDVGSNTIADTIHQLATKAGANNLIMAFSQLQNLIFGSTSNSSSSTTFIAGLQSLQQSFADQNTDLKTSLNNLKMLVGGNTTSLQQNLGSLLALTTGNSNGNGQNLTQILTQYQNQLSGNTNITFTNAMNQLASDVGTSTNIGGTVHQLALTSGATNLVMAFGQFKTIISGNTSSPATTILAGLQSLQQNVIGNTNTDLATNISALQNGFNGDNTSLNQDLNTIQSLVTGMSTGNGQPVITNLMTIKTLLNASGNLVSLLDCMNALKTTMGTPSDVLGNLNTFLLQIGASSVNSAVQQLGMIAGRSSSSSSSNNPSIIVLLNNVQQALTGNTAMDLRSTVAAINAQLSGVNSTNALANITAIQTLLTGNSTNNTLNLTDSTTSIKNQLVGNAYASIADGIVHLANNVGGSPTDQVDQIKLIVQRLGVNNLSSAYQQLMNILIGSQSSTTYPTVLNTLSNFQLAFTGDQITAIVPFITNLNSNLLGGAHTDTKDNINDINAVLVPATSLSNSVYQNVQNVRSLVGDNLKDLTSHINDIGQYIEGPLGVRVNSYNDLKTSILNAQQALNHTNSQNSDVISSIASLQTLIGPSSMPGASPTPVTSPLASTTTPSGTNAQVLPSYLISAVGGGDIVACLTNCNDFLINFITKHGGLIPNNASLEDITKYIYNYM